MNQNIPHQEHDVKGDHIDSYHVHPSKTHAASYDDIRNHTAIWSGKHRAQPNMPFIIHGPGVGSNHSTVNIVPTLREELIQAKRKLSPTQTVVKSAPLTMGDGGKDV